MRAVGQVSSTLRTPHPAASECDGVKKERNSLYAELCVALVMRLEELRCTRV